jgi:hypothetical protein
MRRWMPLTAAIACVTALTWGAAPAQADPSALTWEFTSCTGPAGTPASFSAWRTSQSVGNALHLVDGSGSFVVLIAYNEDLGAYNVPVISPGKTTAAVVQCSTIGPALGFHLTVWGLFAP